MSQMVNTVVQLASSPTPGMVAVSGYVCAFGDRQVLGGPDHGGFTERIDRDVFVKALEDKPDVHLILARREGPPLASTKDGTLKLSVDDQGLRMEAEVHAGQATLMRDGILGYEFRAKKDQWDELIEHRVVHELSLHKCEIRITEARPGDQC